MSDPAFISVVSPIYNTEPYLEQCIRSVLSQTHEHFEYILVENQSTDRSLEIASDYAAKDRRIRLVRTPTFFGQLENFNFTLSQISPDSRYTKMVLSDDFIFPNCLAEMSVLADQNPEIGMVGSYRLVGTRPGGFGVPVERTVMSGRDACRLHLLDGIFLFGSPTTLMYRSDMVRARPGFFRAERIHPDTDIVFELLSSYDFGFVHQVLSFCREREDSVTGAMQDYYPIALDRMVLVSNHGKTYLDEAELAYCTQGAERFLYDGLARELLARPRQYPKGDFWEFQRKGLATAGISIDTARLARAALRVVGKTMANPLSFVKALRDGQL